MNRFIYGLLLVSLWSLGAVFGYNQGRKEIRKQKIENIKLIGELVECEKKLEQK